MTCWSRSKTLRKACQTSQQIGNRGVPVIGQANAISRNKTRTMKKTAGSTVVADISDANCGSRIPKVSKSAKGNRSLSKKLSEQSKPTKSEEKELEKSRPRRPDGTKKRDMDTIPRKTIEEIESRPGRPVPRIRKASDPISIPRSKSITRRKVKPEGKEGEVQNLSKKKKTQTGVSSVRTLEPKAKRSPKPKGKSVQSHALPLKKKKKTSRSGAEGSEPFGTLLKICETMRHDMDEQGEIDHTASQSRTEFIDQCLTFSKECDEATGRIYRLLEEISLMRHQSRAVERKAWSRKTTRCQEFFRNSALKLKGACLNGPNRDFILDSPMDNVLSWDLAVREEECVGLESKSMEKFSDAADRDTPERTPAWIHQISGSPIEEELRGCLDKMAKLELENRALKELLMFKCSLPNDSGIDDLVKLVIADRPSSHRKRVGNISLDFMGEMS